jgi:PAS domain S-box-containing protein
LFGFPPDKKLGYEDFLLIVHDEDREKVNQAWESALTGEPYDIEHRIVIDGQVKWMHEKAVLDFNENGTPVFGIGTVTDITERKRVEVELKEKQEELEAQAEELEMQMEELRTKNEELEVQIMERKRAEEALNDNEKKFKTLFDLLPVGISILDKDRGIVKTNVALENILGIDKDGFNKGVYQRRKYLRADGTEMPANEFPSSRSFNENKNVENVEICVVKEDGSAVWTNVSAVQMPYRDWAMVLTTSNITGLKQAEKSLERTIQQLKESNEQLSAIKTVTESAMSTLNLTELLNSILNSIMRVMNADAIVILLREDDYVRVRASIGFGKDDISQFSVPIGTGFAGKIAGSGQPQYIEDAQTDKIIASSVLKNAGIRSIIGVPIRHMGEVIGVLHVEWMTIHPFNKQEQDFLQILADSCSASIINAKLFEKTKTGE